MTRVQSLFVSRDISLHTYIYCSTIIYYPSHPPPEYLFQKSHTTEPHFPRHTPLPFSVGREVYRGVDDGAFTTTDYMMVSARCAFRVYCEMSICSQWRYFTLNPRSYDRLRFCAPP